MGAVSVIDLVQLPFPLKLKFKALRCVPLRCLRFDARGRRVPFAADHIGPYLPAPNCPGSPTPRTVYALRTAPLCLASHTSSTHVIRAPNTVSQAHRGPNPAISAASGLLARLPFHRSYDDSTVLLVSRAKTAGTEIFRLSLLSYRVKAATRLDFRFSSRIGKLDGVLDGRRICSLCATNARLDLAAMTKSFDIRVKKRQMFSRTELKSAAELELATDGEKGIGAGMGRVDDVGIALYFQIVQNSRRSCWKNVAAEYRSRKTHRSELRKYFIVGKCGL